MFCAGQLLFLNSIEQRPDSLACVLLGPLALKLSYYFYGLRRALVCVSGLGLRSRCDLRRTFVCVVYLYARLDLVGVPSAARARRQFGSGRVTP